MTLTSNSEPTERIKVTDVTITANNNSNNCQRSALFVREKNISLQNIQQRSVVQRMTDSSERTQNTAMLIITRFYNS